MINKSGGITKTFGKYVSLNVISMLGLSVYILADTFFIANGVGNNGLVALNLVLPVFSILNGFGLMLGIGASTRFSIASGSGNLKKGEKLFTQVITVGGIVGILCTFLGCLFAKQICIALGADTEVVEYAREYFFVLASFSLAFIFNHILVCFVRNDKAPKLAMSAMMASSLFNIVMDWVFIYPCKMGIAGAALATGLSPIVSMLILSSHFIRRKNSFKIVKSKLSASDMSKVLGAGAPTFVTEISNGLIILVFNLIILQISGNVGVGAYSVIANLSLVGISLFNGVGQGIQPLVSYYFGANDNKSVKKIYFLALGFSLVLGIVMYLCFYIFRYPIIDMFNKDKITELTTLAAQGMILYCIAFLFMGLSISSISFFACVIKPKQAFAVSLCRGLVAPLPIVLLLSWAFKLTGVWLSIPIAELITTIVAFLFVYLYFKKNKKSENNMNSKDLE